MNNLSRKELNQLLRKGELWCSCADAPATQECIDGCHLIVDEHTRKVVLSRLSWSDE